MVFIESQLFTKLLPNYLSDEEYQQFQRALMTQPDLGEVIQGTGGIRKIRWSSQSKGKGKRGGIRIIYYHQNIRGQIYLLTLYAKNEITDLSSEDKKILRTMTERWKDHG